MYSQFTVLPRYTSRSGIAGSYGSSSFSFLRSIHTVLHTACTNFHAHQKCKRVPFSVPPSPAFLVCRLFDDWCEVINLAVVFICISLVTSRASQEALVVKNPPADVGDVSDEGSIPGSGRPPGGGHGNPLQCSGLENPVDRRAWWATVRGVAESRTRLNQLCTHMHAE